MIFTTSLVLCFSYSAFVFTRLMLSLAGVRVSPKALLRCAQSLVLISIVLPAALNLVPKDHMPKLSVRVIKPYSEEGNSKLRPTSANGVQLKTQVEKSSSFETGKTLVFGVIQSLDKNVMLTLWMVGFLICFIKLSLSFQKLRTVLKNTHQIKALGWVRVGFSEKVSIPFSVRLFKTAFVVLPEQMLTMRSDCKLAVKHELQHHRQGDTLWSILIELLQCFFYFNPAFYLWKNSIIELQEFSCDEALIGQRGVSAREYGSCLVRVAETALRSREMYAGTTCMAAVSKNPKAFKSLLKRRIEIIMHGSKSAKKLAGAFLGTVTILFTVFAAYGLEQSSQTKNNGAVSVNPDIQRIADQVLNRALQSEGAQAGFAIVADPTTGQILAVSNIDHQKNRTGQWALSERMEPASIMKGILAAEAIEQGTTEPKTMHSCENGSYTFAGQVFHDWKETGWDQLSTTDTIANSSDICAMKIAEGLGLNKLQQMFSKYHFGTLQLNPSLVSAAAYGEGFKVLPLDVVRAYGAIANGGILTDLDLSKDLRAQSQSGHRILSEETSRKMREVLEQVVKTGTAHGLPKTDYSLAGKTASSFSGGVLDGDSTGGPNKTDIAGFVGFAPVASPKVEVYVTIFSPNDKSGAHGAAHAAPVVKELADEVLKFLGVAPDQAVH